MKTTIYYFSGTGNSLKVAKDLAEKLIEADIVPITKIINENVKVTTSSDKIGIVYPVYIWGVPRIVSDFIKKIPNVNKDKYFFAVATNGGKVAGSLVQLSQKLSSKGFKLSLGFSIILPTNYTPKHGALPIDKQSSLFAAAEKRLDEIALLIKNNSYADIEKGSFKDYIKNTCIINKLLYPFIHKMDKLFWTNDDCISCGLCEKICPVQSIVLKDGKPVWLHKCEQCFRCVNYCPKAAIQFSKTTEGKERYKNPHIKLNDLIEK